MDYPLEATGTHTSGRPLLEMQDQDHPDRMNQIVWSLMAILDWAAMEGVTFDADNPASFNAVRDAIAAKINAAKIDVASPAEVRKAENNSKYLSPFASLAARGQYAGCMTITSNTALAAAHAGNLIVASGNTITALTLPPLTDLGAGSAITFANHSIRAVNLTAPASHTLRFNNAESTALSVAPGQSAVALRLDADTWQVVLDSLITREFETSFTLAQGASYSHTHGLGRMPRSIQVFLERPSTSTNSDGLAWYGIEPGERILVDTGPFSGLDRGVSIRASNTHLNIKVAGSGTNAWEIISPVDGKRRVIDYAVGYFRVVVRVMA